MLALVLSVFSLLFVLYQYALVPLFFSPLRRIPAAHWSCRFSPVWILWKRFRFLENATIYAAHKEHGSVVLLAPGELSVNCVDDGLRTIYAGGFEKHQYYTNLFGNYGITNMFSTAETGPHSFRKRMMSNVYSKSSVQSSAAFSAACDTIVRQKLLSRIQAQDCKPVDGRLLFDSATMDIVTTYLFGMANASDFLTNREEAARWLNLYQSRRKHSFWPQEMPQLQYFLARIGIFLAPRSVDDANQELEGWCMRLCNRAESHLKDADSVSSNEKDRPAVYSQLRSQLDEKSSKDMIMQSYPNVPKHMFVASEMLDHLSAGHETSGITLTFLFHELSLRPSLQKRMRAELGHFSLPISRDSGNKAENTFPTAKQLDALPLLHAIIMETLRLHAAIPGAEPRMTPSHPGGVTLGSFSQLPGGLRVSSSACCLHRNETVFPSPDRWIPERWLQDPALEPEDDAARLREQHRWFWAFSSGGRMCIGSHLAMAQMKAITAALVAVFAIESAAPLRDTAGAEPFELLKPFLQEDAYTASPIDDELPLRFVPL